MAELKIIGTSSKGTKVEFSDITELTFKSNRFTPADSLEFCSLTSVKGKRIMKICAYLHGKLLFDGMVDVQKTICDDKGIRSVLVCRSKCALMLDNEVIPRLYQNLSAEQLIQTHGIKYGANGHSFSGNPVLKQILARKGFSHWEFISLFCKIAFGKSPFIDQNGKIALSPFSTRELKFGEKGDIPFTKATQTEDRYNMISALFIQSSVNDFGAQYNKIINNKIAQTIGVLRERYYHPGAEWGEDLWLSGSNIIREKQLDYFEIELVIPDLIDARVGDLASVDSKLCSYSDLYVSSVILTASENGFTSTVKLWDKKIL